MENFEENKQFGVLDYRIESSHYIVHVRWRDGKENEHHFPERGFSVYATNGKRAGTLSGKEALKILEENSPKMTEEEFSWLDFVKKVESD